MNQKNVLTFVGDVFYPKDTGERFAAENVVYNQEFVISRNPALRPAEGKVNLKCNSDMAGILFENSKERYACLANNHIFDYGEEGFIDTKVNLEKEKVRCFGENLNTVSVYELNNIKFSLLGYYIQAFCKQEEILKKSKQLENDIKTAREKGAKRVIVSFHFGNEHYPNSSLQQREIARIAIDIGADLVIGHHTHCIQEKENYKGKWIYYSLGNFMFPNFQRDSFFDPEGKSQGRFRWKNTYWTRYFAIVEYDLESGKVNDSVAVWDDFNICRKSKNRLKRKFGQVPNKVVGEFRKILLLFYWNMNVDGKLIDVSNIKRKLIRVYINRISSK